MKKIKIAVLGMALVFILGACGANDSTEDEIIISKDVETEIITLIEDNLVAANERDADAYMSHLIAEEQTDESRTMLVSTLDMYEEIGLTFDSENGQVIYQKGDEAVVEIRQKTRTAEYDIDNNFQSDSNALHVVVNEMDEWKILYTFIVKSVWLNEDGTLDTEGDLFDVVDDTELWDRYIDEMRDLNTLPSEYIAGLE